jgi:hypothetical protein
LTVASAAAAAIGVSTVDGDESASGASAGRDDMLDQVAAGGVELSGTMRDRCLLASKLRCRTSCEVERRASFGSESVVAADEASDDGDDEEEDEEEGEVGGEWSLSVSSRVGSADGSMSSGVMTIAPSSPLIRSSPW